VFLSSRAESRSRTYASQLIDSGVDIVTISKRLGHVKPDITLRVYAHLFREDNCKAAAAINEAFNRWQWVATGTNFAICSFRKIG
jgi:integrase